MTYVIKRSDGKYVTNPGSLRSFTDKLQHARVFATRDSARRECCVDNEHVVNLDDEMGR